MSENPKSIILIQSYGEKLALKDRFLAEGTINIGILGKKTRTKIFLECEYKKLRHICTAHTYRATFNLE